MQSTQTLLSTLLIAMVTVGCASTGQMPTKPGAPSDLKVWRAGDGMICYSEQDHRELVRYLDALESGYD